MFTGLHICTDMASDINERASDGRKWLVVGPNCWAADKHLSLALDEANGYRPDFSQGTFVAFVVCNRLGVKTRVDDFGGWWQEGIPAEEREAFQSLARTSRRTVAVTAKAATQWKQAAKAALQAARKESA